MSLINKIQKKFKLGIFDPKKYGIMEIGFIYLPIRL